MKNVFYILLLSFFIISCSSGDDSTDPIDKEIETALGKQVFRIDLKELTAKGESDGAQKNLEPAFALVSINNTDGAAILAREKVTLLKVGDSYVTEEIILESGTYSVIEFIVTDVNDIVISIAPKEDSVLAQFTTKPLPFDFVVSADETRETVTENINAAGYASLNFGYTGLNLTFPENTNFFSITVDDSNELSSKTLNLKSITGSTYLVDWGDGIIEEYVSTIIDSGIENTISHTYTENGVYTINVSGSVEAIELLEFGSNDQESNWQSHVTSVDIAKLTLLKSCLIYGGYLTTLYTSENEALEFLNLSYNQVSSLDFTNNPNLKTVWLRHNQLTTLDTSQNPNMEFFWVEGNEISNLDLSNNSKLKVVLVRENNLTNIDFSGNLALERFDVANNAITAIDLSSNQALREINVGANNLQNIDLVKNTNLVRIDLYMNQLTTIDLSANLKLQVLYIENNNLTDLDLSANLDLERLYIKNNNFSNLDISLNTKISHLNIGGNQFNEAEIDQMINLIYDRVVSDVIMNGYINYLNNPGTLAISNQTISNINDMIVNYNWFFNNG